MSMKRAKKATGGRTATGEGSLGFNPPSAELPKWPELIAGADEAAFVAYAPAQRFERGAFLTHVRFGKGYVLSVDGPRIEVIFEDAVRKLGHGMG